MSTKKKLTNLKKASNAATLSKKSDELGVNAEVETNVGDADMPNSIVYKPTQQS